MRRKIMIPVLVATLCMSGCSAKDNAKENINKKIKEEATQIETVKENTGTDSKDVEVENYASDKSDTHAIEADGEDVSYENITVKKTGDSEGDEADFYGTNAAVFATNGATLTIHNSNIKTDGAHANAVFSYGEGTTINITDTQIETEKATSGGVMVTGGGTLNATNLTVTTKAGSSAPIRSDRGGGQLNVTGGTFKSYGSGSPAIYSTAEINVDSAELYADVAEAVVVEGKNSVKITNSDVTGNNTVHNSDKADIYRNVMIYQSMSGDSDEGKGEFTMTGGKLTSMNGGMFFVTNTQAEISLENVELQYATDDLLRIEKAGWGNEDSNGGHVTFNAKNQNLKGVITVDEISTLNMYLKDDTLFNGSIDSKGNTYVEIDDNSTWTLTKDTEIKGLTCGEKSINLNGFTLKVDGKIYIEGTKSEGEAVKVEIDASAKRPEGMKEGKQPPEKPEGMKEGEQPPEKPEGMRDGKQPPEKPEGERDDKQHVDNSKN